MVSKDELFILSFYRSSELAGCILFGKLAFITDIDEIRADLTEHCLEEAEHTMVFTRLIRDLGNVPLKVTDTYQTEYGKLAGMPKNMLEILCLTQVLEKRVVAHYSKHMRKPGIHPKIYAALKQMVEEETEHVGGWVLQKLDQYAQEHGKTVVEETLKKFTEYDTQVYDKLSSQSPFKEYFEGVE